MTVALHLIQPDEFNVLRLPGTSHIAEDVF
jgi:hypothetical protein